MGKHEQLAHDIAPDLEPYLLSFNSTRFLGRVTAFPASADIPGGLQTDDWCIRTDNDYECYYDGTRWLTRHEYVAPINDYFFGVAGGAAYAGGVVQSIARAMTRTDFTIYITRFVLFATCSVLQTAVNNWRVAFQSNFSATTNALYNTNGQAAATLVLTEIAVGAITQNAAASSETRMLVDVKNGVPGTIVLEAAMYYRLVVV
jgi:hypothetical protein